MGWHVKFATGSAVRGLPSVLIGELISSHNEKADTVTGISDITAINVRELLSLTAFQNSMTAMIFKFVNHTDSSGNWVGGSTIPNWTPTTLMTSLGESRLAVPATRELLGAWIIQQYDILELLRWTNKFSDIGTSGGFQKRATSPNSWAECETRYLADTPGSSTGFWFEYNSSHFIWIKEFEVCPVPYAPLSALDYDADIYGMYVRLFSIPNFETGFGFIEDSFFIQDTKAAQSGGFTIPALNINTADIALTDPQAGNLSCGLQRFEVINKWDFEFKDY